MQMEWYRQIHKEGSTINKRAKFNDLLKFLCAERNAIEYAMSDLRKSKSSSSRVFTIESNSESGCIIHFWSDNHSTSDCRTFNNLSLKNKLDVIKQKSACVGCLNPGHALSECKHKSKCDANDNCLEFHHPSLHVDPKDANANTIADNCSNPSDHVLLPIMKVEPVSKRCSYLSCLWDSGADISLITSSKARTLRLTGKPAKLSVTVAGGDKTIVDSFEYTLLLKDRNQVARSLKVYGIERITNAIAKIDIGALEAQFDGANLSDIERPDGEVDLLIGYDYAGWHPVAERANEHLVILSNIFGKCVAGRSLSMIENTKRNIVRVSVVNLVKSENILGEFMTIESLGVQCHPKCGNCRCGSCPIGGKSYSIKEERELKLIENNLEFKGTHWVAGYPWLKDAYLLPDNYDYALKRLESTERSLSRDPNWMKIYSEQIHDMVSRGVARKLSRDEVSTYSGPVHYICHHAVLKPDSLSTPVRIVWDSSHSYKGHSLNDYWAKGPDAFMNDLLTVLLKFRENCVGIAGDIKKMYNSVHIKEFDQHVHRFLWRERKEDPPEIFVITAVNIGDRPSGTIATLALRKTALMGKNEHPKEAMIVTESSYVDDIVDSVSDNREAHDITGGISALLRPGNFFIKGWSISGEGDQELQKTLGLSWQPLMDTIQFDVRVNFSKRVRGRRTGPDLSADEISNKVPTKLTKRAVMSQLNGIYDPLGLLVPVTVKGKLLLRDLWAMGLDWDTLLDPSDQEKWMSFFQEMLQINSLKFPRSIKPTDASEKLPVLISFSDASSKAFGCCMYVRWELKDGTYQSHLLIGKSRVAPLKVTTIVRLELSAALLAKRLRSVVATSFRTNFQCIIHIVDSQIVKAMISKDSYGFNTFVATRVGEIQTTTSPDEWYWVDTKSNVADIITRGATVSDLNSDSDWQNGPKFMSQPIEEWPMYQEFNSSDELPEVIKNVFTSAAQVHENPLIEIERFSNYSRLLRVTAIILQLKLANPNHTLRNLGTPLEAEHIEKAKAFWVEEAQKSMKIELEKGIFGKGSYRKLNVRKVNGIYVAAGRIEAWNEFTYNKSELIILPANHRYSELYARYIHNQAHRGVCADIAKIRSEYWIVGIRRLVKRIRNNCIPCRRYDGKLLEQVMAPLPLERVKPSPVWYNTALDLFGPFAIKGEVNKRTLGKGYGVIFTCLITRAVFVDVACDYSTDGFLLVFRRFVSVRGYPAKIFSDSGSQLIAASKELKEMFNNFDWKRIKDAGAAVGLEWKFSPPEAPWYNGSCEALIRSVKKSIMHAIGNHKATFSEFQTVLYECANIVNERPIGTTSKSVDDGTYLCPNDILLGRSTNKVPTGDFDQTANSRKRVYFVQRMADCFWKKWTSDYFPSLLERKRWHHAKRNASVDDIVIIQDKDLKRSQWKIGVITEVTLANDGKVRRVKVKYVHPSGTHTIVERPVQNLVVLLAAEERRNHDSM